MCPYRYICYNCDEESSVYSEVIKILKTKPNWKVIQTSDYNDVNAHLILAHRNHIPFKLLGGTYQGQKQLVNYYRGSREICRKSSHARLIKQHCQDLVQYNWFPSSFLIFPTSSSSSMSVIQQAKLEAQKKLDERKEFLQVYQQTHDKVWIAKSSTGAKGEGILISNNPEKLIKFVEKSKQPHIIQKYIENPLLLHRDRKFDIRVWVVLDHNMDIHIFKQGVLRTSSDSYKPEDLTDVTSHLTNHCVQEAMSSNYGKYEEGNELFYDQFNRFLQSKYGTNMDEKITPQINIIIEDSINMIYDKLDPSQVPYHSFQLFGFDFMVDIDFKVWLIEINHSPGCAKKLLPSLADSIVVKVINRIFATKETGHEKCDTFYTINR